MGSGDLFHLEFASMAEVSLLRVDFHMSLVIYLLKSNSDHMLFRRLERLGLD